VITLNVSMSPPQFRRLTPFVLLFALVQALAPAFAAIADGWRLDQRTPYAHMESETHEGCVVVHTHDCALCSVATSANGVQQSPATAAAACTGTTVVVIEETRRPRSGARRSASQRAPPGIRG